MFSNDPIKEIYIELKEKVSLALDSDLHSNDHEALTELYRLIDDLILYYGNNYEEFRRSILKEFLDVSIALSVTTNKFIRESILPMIDFLTDDLVDEG